MNRDEIINATKLQLRWSQQLENVLATLCLFLRHRLRADLYASSPYHHLNVLAFTLFFICLIYFLSLSVSLYIRGIMDSEFFTLIQYLALERYSHHMETVCLTAIDRQGIDPILSLWKAVSLLFQERIPECIQELENVKDKKDVTLCACLALRYDLYKYQPRNFVCLFIVYLSTSFRFCRVLLFTTILVINV